MIQGSITTTPHAFAAAVRWAAKFIDPKPSVPVHAGLLLWAANGELTITATSDTATAHAVVPFDGDGTGNVLVSGRLLDALVGTFPAQPVTLDMEDEVALTINAGRWSGELPTMSVEDFPSAPGELPAIGTVPGDAFATAVHRAGAARSTDAKQPVEMHLMHLTFAGDTVTALCTNRFRLARDIAPFDAEAGGDVTDHQEATALVLAQSMLDVADSFTGPDEVLVGLSDSSISLTSPTRSVTLRQIDSPYAMLEQLRGMFEQALPDTATARKADFTEPLKRAALMRDKDGPVGVRFTSDLISVIAASGEAKRGGTEEIDATYSGADHEMRFNPQFFADAVRTSPSDTVEISFAAGTGKPIIVTAPGNTAWRHILMPIRKLS